jgi:hypothetical protein
VIKADVVLLTFHIIRQVCTFHQVINGRFVFLCGQSVDNYVHIVVDRVFRIMYRDVEISRNNM